MLNQIFRDTIRKFCLKNKFDYYDTVIFIEYHIKETQNLIRRQLNRQEIMELTLNAMSYLSTKNNK